jgi:large subunit ribosomal protein L25
MSSSSATVEGQLRSGRGKGAARRLRSKDLVPGVVYSKAKGAVSIAVEPKSLSKALLGAKRRNQLISLQLKDDAGAVKSTHHVLTKEVQINAVRRNALHIDFLEVDPNLAIEMKVPLETVGKSRAVIAGAKIQIVLRSLNVLVKPGEVPEKIVLDTTESEVGVIRAKNVVMPAGCTLLNDAEQPVLSIRMPRGEKPADEPAAAAPAGKKK